MKKFILILTLILIHGCGSGELPAGDIAGTVFFPDRSEKKQFIFLMKNNNIPFEVDERNEIIYLLRDKASVLGLRRQVLYGDNLREDIIESTVIVDGNFRHVYESVFSENKIPYSIDTSDGVTQIRWNQKQGKEVDIVIQDIEFLIRRARWKDSGRLGPYPQ